MHASPLARPDVQQHIIEFLCGGSGGYRPGPYYPIIRHAAAAWQVPALPLSVNPVWDAKGQPDAAFADDACEAAP